MIQTSLLRMRRTFRRYWVDDNGKAPTVWRAWYTTKHSAAHDLGSFDNADAARAACEASAGQALPWDGD